MDRERTKTVGRRQFLRGVMATGAALAATATPPLLRRALGAEPIKIGAILHLTGPLSPYGLEQKRTLELFVKQRNARGGIIGRTLKLIIEDDGGRAQVSVEKARKLVSRDKVDVLTGLMGTPAVIAVEQYVREAKVLLVCNGGLSQLYAQPPNCNRYFFHCYPIPGQMCAPTMKIAEKFANARWYFVGSDYAFGHDGVAMMKKYAQAAGKVNEAGTSFSPLGTKDFTPVVSTISAAKPDIIAMAVPGFDYSILVKQIRLFGIKAHLHAEYLSTLDSETAGDAAIGITGGVPFLHENPKVSRAKQFTEDFHKEVGRWPEWLAATTMNSMEIYALAVEKVGSTDNEKLADLLSDFVHEHSLLGVTRMRACDHQSINTMYLAEMVRHPRYGLTYKLMHEIPDREVEKLMTPCGQTGCEPAMKRA